MCGLVGIAGNLEYADEVMMKRLFVFDYFRGPDSTGLAAIHPTGEVSLVKRATHPLNLFDSKEFDKALDARQSWVFLGHNRAATLGAVNDANAHPFQYGDIIGAHNGTLDKTTWRALEEASGVETNVDSAAIFACINAIGIDATVALMEEGRTSTTGAWALVWYDKKDETLRFLKNKHRPLYFGVHEKGNRLVWASEWVMMRAAEEMTGGWDTSSNKEGHSYFPLMDDWLYEFKVHDLMEGFTIDDLKKSKNRKLKGKEPAPVLTTTMGTAPFRTQKTAAGQTSTTDSDSTTSGGTGIKTPRVVSLEPISGDPFGGLMTVKGFNEMSSHGHCSWCADDININTPGLTVFLEEEVVLCSKCTNLKGEDNKVFINSRTMDNYV